MASVRGIHLSGFESESSGGQAPRRRSYIGSEERGGEKSLVGQAEEKKDAEERPLRASNYCIFQWIQQALGLRSVRPSRHPSERRVVMGQGRDHPSVDVSFKIARRTGPVRLTDDGRHDGYLCRMRVVLNSLVQEFILICSIYELTFFNLSTNFSEVLLIKITWHDSLGRCCTA
jgi:hypothetical protein